jgi:cytochrome c553
MVKTMRVGRYGRAALAATVALALVQVPALAQTNSGSVLPPATAPAAAPATPASPPTSAVSATTDPAGSGPIDPFAHGTVAAGATQSAVCSACHGPNGNSPAGDATAQFPRLAGQSAVYIAEQLRLFRAGTRDNPIMKPLAANLTDQAISDLAVYYQAQTVSGLEANPTTWKAGETLYRRGDKTRDIPACIACHGPAGRGNIAAGYPALRAQQGLYVKTQLTNYANGSRYTGTNVGTMDPNSVMMFTIAKRLTPDDIVNVASYVQGMR